MKKKDQKPTWLDWLKAGVACLLYACFLWWAECWWGIVLMPLIFDAYVTQRINWGWWRKLENPVTRSLMSWADALVFALVAVYFVNIYLFQNYTIPSSSLEKSLLVGDYLFVSKTSYGARAPMTPLSMPLCQHTLPGGARSFLKWPQWKYKRVHPKPVAEGDIVVFNYPQGDSVLLGSRYAETDYYELCCLVGRQLRPVAQGSEAVTLGREFIRQHPEEFGTLSWRPVDRRENYVKRCVGLPGQWLEIRERTVYTDGKPQPEPENAQYTYRIELQTRTLPQDLAKETGISTDDQRQLYQSGTCPLTAKMAARLRERRDVVRRVELEGAKETDMLFPTGVETGWTTDDYGPVWIPKKGATIKLTPDNLPLYERCIRVYEGNSLSLSADGGISINGKRTDEYTFRMDYYWMMGDNRHNSADSRYWGFVPEDHIVGKPLLVWWSRDKDYSIFNGGIRWKRLFRLVDKIR
ncbi:MAG: S26 family signal peptidase [Prevotellaceae bacterium]|nr:S26 family signal peptidase [Prevotellaceae bacterium]